MSLSIIAAAFYAVYCVHMGVILWLAQQFCRSQKQPKSYVRYYRVGWHVALWLPLVLAGLAAYFVLLPQTPAAAAALFPFMVLIISVPHAVFLFALSLGVSYIENKYRTDRLSRSNWLVLTCQYVIFVAFMGLCSTGTLYLVGRTPDVATPIFSWLIPIAVAFVIHQRAFRATRAKPVTTDETPFHAEVKKIAQHFGFTDIEIRLIPLRPKQEGSLPDKAEKLLHCQAWYPSFSLRRPWVPLELVQLVNSTWLTAALAAAYARRGHLPRFLQWIHTSKYGKSVPIAVGVLASFKLLDLIPLHQAPGSIRLGTIFALLVAGVILAAVVLVLHPAIFRRNHLSHAYDAWKQTEKSEERTPYDFLAAIVQFDYVFLGCEKLEPLITSFESAPAVRKFVRRYIGRPMDEVLKEIAQRIEAEAYESTLSPH